MPLAPLAPLVPLALPLVTVVTLPPSSSPFIIVVVVAVVVGDVFPLVDCAVAAGVGVGVNVAEAVIWSRSAGSMRHVVSWTVAMMERPLACGLRPEDVMEVKVTLLRLLSGVTSE